MTLGGNRVYGLGLKASGLGLGGQGLGFRIQGPSMYPQWRAKSKQTWQLNMSSHGM